jgi:toxin FitB
VIILDTNVLSALMRTAPDQRVVTWLDRQPRTSIWTTSLTILEIQFGLQVMPAGRRRSALSEALGTLLANQIANRIAAFDAAAALRAGNLLAACKTKGRMVDLRDTMIAGIVLATHATLATRNTAHFDDLEITLVNPWAD